MDKPRFVYETYIATTAENLWNALFDTGTTANYWQHEDLTDWKPGSR